MITINSIIIFLTFVSVGMDLTAIFLLIFKNIHNVCKVSFNT